VWIPPSLSYFFFLHLLCFLLHSHFMTIRNTFSKLKSQQDTQPTMLLLVVLSLFFWYTFACPEYPNFNISLPNGGSGIFGPWFVI
jgi:hypothetical protein